MKLLSYQSPVTPVTTVTPVATLPQLLKLIPLLDHITLNGFALWLLVTYHWLLAGNRYCRPEFAAKRISGERGRTGLDNWFDMHFAASSGQQYSWPG